MAALSPPPIETNQVFLDLKNAETILQQQYEGRHNALIFSGPPGIGKSHMAERIAREHGDTWHPERPNTKLGLIELLRDYSELGVPTLVLDDMDEVFQKTPILQVLMTAFDTKPRRYLSHRSGTSITGMTTTIDPFEIGCRCLFLTNLDFNDPKVLKVNGMAALKSRSLIAPITHDAESTYHYTGWLATDGKMLDLIRVDFAVGRVIHRDGQQIVVGKKTRRWRLSRTEKNDVLTHFHEHATRYPSVTPRELVKYARMRLGERKETWLTMVNAQMLPKSKWVLPADLYRYRIGTDSRAERVENGAPVTAQRPDRVTALIEKAPADL